MQKSSFQESGYVTCCMLDILDYIYKQDIILSIPIRLFKCYVDLCCLFRHKTYLLVKALVMHVIVSQCDKTMKMHLVKKSWAQSELSAVRNPLS